MPSFNRQDFVRSVGMVETKAQMERAKSPTFSINTPVRMFAYEVPEMKARDPSPPAPTEYPAAGPRYPSFEERRALGRGDTAHLHYSRNTAPMWIDDDAGDKREASSHRDPYHYYNGGAVSQPPPRYYRASDDRAPPLERGAGEGSYGYDNRRRLRNGSAMRDEDVSYAQNHSVSRHSEAYRQRGLVDSPDHDVDRKVHHHQYHSRVVAAAMPAMAQRTPHHHQYHHRRSRSRSDSPTRVASPPPATVGGPGKEFNEVVGTVKRSQLERGELPPHLHASLMRSMRSGTEVSIVVERKHY